MMRLGIGFGYEQESPGLYLYDKDTGLIVVSSDTEPTDEVAAQIVAAVEAAGVVIPGPGQAPPPLGPEEEMRRWIDEASYTLLLSHSRFALPGDPYFQGEMGDYDLRAMERKLGGVGDAAHFKAIGLDHLGIMKFWRFGCGH